MMREQDAAFADMELDAALSSLRFAAERVLRALGWQARSGGAIETGLHSAICLLAEMEHRARIVRAEYPLSNTRVGGDVLPKGLA